MPLLFILVVIFAFSTGAKIGISEAELAARDAYEQGITFDEWLRYRGITVSRPEDVAR